MFSYMVELNDAESFLVAYSNYETIQKNVYLVETWEPFH